MKDECERNEIAVTTLAELEVAHDFFDAVRADPFVAVVISPGGQVRLFARADITPDHLEAIKEGLSNLLKESDG